MHHNNTSNSTWVCTLIVFIALIAAFMFFGLDAIARESEWREDRMCKYYSEEINAYAARQGKSEQCEQN